MAGAAVAPALGVISAHFAGENPMLIQMIISMPALFIFATNLLFPVLSRRFRSRTLVLTGLTVYVVGGCLAGAFSDIRAVLAARALVGIGVGIIMPLSTGLLPFYFSAGMQNKLMGYSSAASQIGGVIATFASGMLAQISWRASFLVYLMGLIAMLLCVIFLPNDDISVSREQINAHDAAVSADRLPLAQLVPLVAAIFLLMTSFFLYPSSFAMETSKAGLIPAAAVTVIMTAMDLAGFFSSFFFDNIIRFFGARTRLVAPSLFLLAYVLLSLSDGWFCVVTGSLLVGVAQGAGMPFIMATAARRGGHSAASTVMPYLSAFLYLAQFSVPVLLGTARTLAAPLALTHVPWLFGIAVSALLLLWSAFMLREPRKAVQKSQRVPAANQAQL